MKFNSVLLGILLDEDVETYCSLSVHYRLLVEILLLFEQDLHYILYKVYNKNCNNQLEFFHGVIYVMSVCEKIIRNTLYGRSMPENYATKLNPSFSLPL